MRLTSGYYTTIVGGKKELLSVEHKYSGAVCEHTIYIRHIMPYVTGRTSGYHAAIVSGKKELLSVKHTYSGAVCELTVSRRHVGEHICFSEL